MQCFLKKSIIIILSKRERERERERESKFPVNSHISICHPRASEARPGDPGLFSDSCSGFRLVGRNDRVREWGFTLIELLIVIAILAILATVTLLVINPAQMVKQSRDANRITEINQINKALLLYQSFGGSTSMGTHGDVYISLPSSNADCSDLGLPALSSGSYHCATQANYRNIDGTGWIPVDLTSVQSSAGTLFSSLPIDPTNTVASDYYYTYIPGSWALSATMESEKYLTTTAVNDGGESDTRFEMGNNLALNESLVAPPAPSWTCGDIITDIDSNSYTTVQIGEQCWMAENIMTTKYPDGSAITRGLTDATWSGADNAYYAYPPNTANTAEETLENITTNKLGFVYQWSAAMHGSTTAGAQGICPTGWHIPTDTELKILVEYAAGTPGCESSTGWQCSPAGSHLSLYTSGGDNTSGFSGILVGLRNTTGGFQDRSSTTYIWSSVGSGGVAWKRYLHSGYATVNRNTFNKAYGFSVRCLKN
jgi:uncharacterized protein (TIGR02145 family)/prepilin-type N-terminal cleavage/methylation domain-containing protein